MRADRLLSLLMLLQTRGRTPARKLAEALEVSVRTIYRDLDALSAAGVPVYAEPGPEGGCGLLDNYRTNLTALTPDEVRAIFMLSIPAPLAELGVSQALKSALLKLAAALPAERRADEARTRQRLHVDAAGPAPAGEPAPCLAALYRAVWDDRRVWLRYRLPFDAEAERLVDPYGLVASGSAWHLVAAHGGQPRVYPVAQVLAAEPTSERFARPADFDLAEFWRAWRAEHERHRPEYRVTLRAAPELAPRLAQAPEATAAPGPPDAGGRIVVTLTFPSLEAARALVLSWGRAVEVLAPRALRLSVRDFAEQIANLYREPTA